MNNENFRQNNTNDENEIPNLIENWKSFNVDQKYETASNFNRIQDFDTGKNIITTVLENFENLNTEDKLATIFSLEKLGAQCTELENYTTEILLKFADKSTDNKLYYPLCKSIDTKAIRLLLPLEIDNKEISSDDKILLTRIFNSEIKLIKNMPNLQEKNDILYNFSKFGKLPELRKESADNLTQEFEKSEKKSDLYYTLADNLIILSDEINDELLPELQEILKHNIKNNINDTKCFKYMKQIWKIGDASFIPLIKDIGNDFPFPGIIKLSEIITKEISSKRVNND
jgi:hypothetical protein